MGNIEQEEIDRAVERTRLAILGRLFELFRDNNLKALSSLALAVDICEWDFHFICRVGDIARQTRDFDVLRHGTLIGWHVDITKTTEYW